MDVKGVIIATLKGLFVLTLWLCVLFGVVMIFVTWPAPALLTVICGIIINAAYQIGKPL